MKKTNCTYESPVLSLMTVCAEKGFAASPGDPSDVNSMLPGYGIDDVENW